MKKKMISMLLMATITVSAIVLAGCSKGESTKDLTTETNEEQEVNENSSISGINVAWFGSDLINGTGNDGESMVEYVAKRNDQTFTKEAKAGSSMVDDSDDGYIARLEKMDTSVEYDLFVVEMPLCDVNAPVGEFSESENRDDYDTSTIIGSMQYIQSYVSEKFGLDVSFMTPAKCDVKGGSAYSEVLWKVVVPYSTNPMQIDLWHNVDLTSATADYIDKDGNPTKKGYEEMYIPALETILKKVVHEVNVGKINNLPEYDPANVEAIDTYPNLKGKKIIFLGSSVTYGSASKQASFVEYMAARDGIEYVKEAVSGTTLVNEEGNNSNYIARMEANIPPQDADLFICQLSTNDASQDKPLGEVSESRDMNDFDQTTVAGAIEYIIAYAQEKYNCPVMFYTGTKYDSEKYQEMVDLLLEIQKKWGIGVIDMWNDLPVEDLEEGKYDFYMENGIHPDRAGYLEWWTPFMEKEISEFLDK